MRFPSVNPAGRSNQAFDDFYGSLVLDKSISELDVIENVYPVPSDTFLPFVSTDCLKKFDNFRVDKRLLRSDSKKSNEKRKYILL